MSELLWLSVMIIAVNVKWIGAVLLSLTLFGCGGPKPADSPETAAATAPAIAPPSDTRPVIVAFGDSLSAGYGLEPGQSFPDVVQRRLDAAGYKYHVVNMGVSGDTTTDGLTRLPDVLAAKPQIVILEFGGNDGLRGLPVSATKNNIYQMIAALRDAQVQILLAGMSLPRNYGPDYIHSFEQVYVDAERHYHEYPVTRIPFLLDGVGGHPNLMQPDGIHPNAQGAEIVATIVMKYLEPLLKK